MVMAAAAVAVAVLTVSCVRELDFTRPVNENGAVVNLTPVCIDPATKADGDQKTEPGADTYQENLIVDYYYFIYSDESGSNLLQSGYSSGNGATVIPLGEFPIASGDGWVYVVANLPTKPASPVEGDEWFELNTTTKGLQRVVQGGSTTQYAGTLEGLQKIDFGKNMPTSYPKSSEFYEYTSATTGIPKPEKFVMRTKKLVKFTIVDNTTTVNVKAGLERVAVKIILDMYVAKKVQQMATTVDGGEQYKKSWDSDINHIQIYMLWGSTRGNLAGTPVTYGAQGVLSSWFYSASPRYAMYTEPVGGYFNGTFVEGSVPSDRYQSKDYPVMTTVWDYVYVVDETQGEQGWIWNSNLPSDADSDWKDTHRGDYYYGDWAYDPDKEHKQINTFVDDDGVTKQQRQSTTQTEIKPYYKISSLPLYTMPISWNVNDAHAPFIKVILPWQGYYEQAVDGHAAGERDTKTTEFYYKILIPELTTLDANGCYHIKLDLSVLGSTADEVPVELSGQYHVVAWNTPAQITGGDQSAGRYLDCPTHYEFYSQNEMNIPVRSSHNIVISSTPAPSATYNNYTNINVSTGTLSRHATDSTGNNYVISTSGSEKVTVHHKLTTTIADLASRDIAPITYTFRIQHADDATYFKDITVVQYPSLYIENRVNSNWTTSGNQFNTQYGYVYVNTPRTTSGQSWQTVVGITSRNSGTSSNPNTYLISTKVLASELGYILGDPRVDVINNLVPANSTTFSSAPALYGNSPRRLSYYYPAEETDRTRNMVAPAFRIASSYGQSYLINRDNARLRCAAYQEDGYPAGRWRLPTMAEIQYITNLSGKLIPRLFNDTAYGTTSVYMSANGIVSINNGVVSVNTTATQAFVRCVYDEWFWGPGRVTNTVFTWGDKQR